jgi:hypothetical protein
VFAKVSPASDRPKVVKGWARRVSHFQSVVWSAHVGAGVKFWANC